jgi:hypothetical protein
VLENEFKNYQNGSVGLENKFKSYQNDSVGLENKLKTNEEIKERFCWAKE